MSITQAILPENMEDDTIESLMTGQTVYVVPWAMWVDEQRRCWLNPRMTTRPEPHGTANMAVTRTEDGVTVSRTDHHYTTSERPPHHGCDFLAYLPVTAIV